jgi:hypothetical protein
LEDKIMAIQEKQKLFTSFLKEDGYKCEFHESSKSIITEYEGRHFCIYFTETDETYVLIEFPKFCKIDSQEAKTKALNIANFLNCKSKGKIILSGENENMGMSVDIEYFYNDGHDFKLFYKKFFNILLSMAHEFIEKWKL